MKKANEESTKYTSFNVNLPDLEYKKYSLNKSLLELKTEEQ